MLRRLALVVILGGSGLVVSPQRADAAEALAATGSLAESASIEVPCRFAGPPLPLLWWPAVGVAVRRAPGGVEVAVCLANTGVDSEAKDTITVAPTAGSGGAALLAGNHVLLCMPSSSSPWYSCNSVGAGGLLFDVSTTTNATSASSVDVCQSYYAWTYENCVRVLAAAGMDGPAGRTMWVGAGAGVCTDGDTGTACVEKAGPVPLPTAVFVDFTPWLDRVREMTLSTCIRSVCT